MATEFNSGEPIKRDSATRGPVNPPTARVGGGRHWSTYVILALLAVVVVTGLLLTVRDTNTDTSASNSAPGVTTGSSVPSPSNPPAVPGPAGQGESNSKR